MYKTFIFILINLAFTICFGQNFNTQRLDSLFHILDQKDKFMGSIAVSQNGKIIYSNAIGFAEIETAKKVDTHTKYRIGSVSKMFTATLVLKAIEENKLTLNKTIDNYFPQIENSEKITISNLLNHRSGIHNFTDDEEYLTYNTQPKTEKEIIEIITKEKSDFEPDSKATYSNSNYVLLSYILEKIYKKDYSTILNQKIIKPLRLKNTYFGSKTNLKNKETYSYHFQEEWIQEPETDMSIPTGAGALISNPIDLTKFIEGLFAGKVINGKSLNLMKTLNDGYGMGIFEKTYVDKKSYGHDGAIDRFRSILTYFPDEKLAIAITSNGSLYKNENILLCAESSFFDQSFEMPTFENLIVDTQILESYTGQYTSEQIPLDIHIKLEENQLFAQATGQSTFPLQASSETIFKFEQAGIVLEFDQEKKQMVLKQAGQEFLFYKK